MWVSPKVCNNDLDLSSLDQFGCGFPTRGIGRLSLTSQERDIRARAVYREILPAQSAHSWTEYRREDRRQPGCMVVRGASGVAYSAPRAGTGIRACVGPSHVLCNRFRNRPIIGKASPQSARSRVSIDVGVNRDCFALARPLIEHPGQVRAFARFLFARPESVRSFVVSLKKCMSGIDTNSHRVPATYRDSPIAISQSIGRFSSISSKIDAVTDELRPGSRS
jgi:hypothetical protein